MTRLRQAGNEPLFAGAVARVFIRRNAGAHSLNRIRAYVRRRARGRVEFAQWGAWTIVDVGTQDDLLAMRERFANLLDGWSAFP